MDVRVDPHAAAPPSRQLVEQLLDAMARGDLAAGDRLPSVRTLAADALVNPNTVGKAYRELESLGVVLGRNGSGVFVTRGGPTKARRARRTRTIDEFREACREALRAGHDAGELTRILDAETAGRTT